MIKISPSILASDFSKLGEEIKKIDLGGADMIHIDVMDGHFVPNITLGAPIVKAVRKYTDKTFDVHLMISDPMKYAKDFADAGADMIVFHAESDSPVKETVEHIKSLGKKVGVALKPATAPDVIFPLLPELDMVLVMTVEPGFGGQSFMEDQMAKVTAVREECRRQGLDTDIQVDGGISDKTVSVAAKAGANVFVAGSFVFRAEDTAQAIAELKAKAE